MTAMNSVLALTIALFALLVCQCRAVSQAECSVLHSLYSESNNGPNWIKSQGWSTFNASKPAGQCCDWHGVSCDAANSTIVAVSLPHNNMSLPNGLPRRWALLTFLSVVDLSANYIHGILPDEWQLLVHMTVLAVEYNAIGGHIPVSWAAMTQLGVLNIGHNRLVGKIPRLSACTAIMCSNVGLNSTVDEIDWEYVADRCPKIWWYLIATAVSGPVPCPRNIKLLELSYTLVSGGVPCCPWISTLGLEGTSVTSWIDCPHNTTPQLLKLFLSHSSVRSVPADLASRFPALTYLSLRNLKLSQPLPSLPSTIEVVDAAENALTAPAAGLFTMSINRRFVLMDVTSSAAHGITLDAINFTCNMTAAPFPGKDCVLRTSPFAALGRPYNPLAIHESSLLNPMLLLLPSRLLVSHMLYDFVAVLSCLFRPTVTVRGAVEGGGIPPHVTIPEPLWNHTFITIPPIPSTISQFDGLVDAPLLFGVVYHLSISFVYRPIILRSGTLGAAQRDLDVGTVTLPVCSPDLYAVPFTQLCVGCPIHAVCNGSSAFFAKTGFWRPSATVLPLFPCDSPGCDHDESADHPPRRGHECALGYEGTTCSVCATGYGKGSSGVCDECSSTEWNVIAVAVGCIVVFAAASLAAVKSVKVIDEDVEAEKKVTFLTKVLDKIMKRSGLVKIMSVAQRQKLQMLLATSVKKLQTHMGMYALVGRMLPAAARQAESKVLQTIQQSLAQLSLRSVSFASCLFPSLNVVTQFQAMLVLVPTLLIVEVVLVRVLRKRWAVFSVVSSICILMYDMSINLALLVIPTERFTVYDAAQFTVNRTFAPPVETRHVLSFDMTLSADDPVNKSWRIVAVLWVVVFGIGLPLTICGFINHLFNTGRRARAEERFAFLTSTYRSKRWYWEQVVLLRKFALGVIVTALQPYPLAQAQAVLVVLMVYLIFMEWQAPFKTTHMHNAERTTCVGAIIIINTILGTLASTNSATNYTMAKFVNTIVQYGALSVLVLFLIAELKAAGSAANECDDDVKQKDGCPTVDGAVIALVRQPLDESPTSKLRSFSLSRVHASSPPEMRKPSEESDDPSL